MSGHARPTASCSGKERRGRGGRRAASLASAIATLLVFGVLLAASGCRTPLRVGTSGDYPPFTARTASGAYEGFDVEVARAYTTDRGRDLEIVSFRWPELEQRLRAGDFDVAMGGVTVRGDRLARAPMTFAVAEADAVVLVRPGREDASLDRPDVKVAVNRGGHLEKLAWTRFSHASIRAVDDNRALPKLLASGEVDAVVTDTQEEKTFTVDFAVVEVLARDRKAYWVAPDEGDLATDMDGWLVQREQDGSLAALRVKYMGTDAGPAFDTGQARLLDLIARRLLLMPYVAEAKRRAGLPVDAPEREAEVVRAAGLEGCRAGLVLGLYVNFVRAQIEAAKAVQRAVLAGPPLPERDAPDLDDDLRPAIDRIDASILGELVRTAPVGASADAIARELRELAPVPGVDEDTMLPLAEALRGVRRRERPS